DFGFIDREGNRSPPGSFAGAGEFSEGLAAVCVKHDRGWAYIDARGKTRIPTLACSSAGEFQGGLAPIQVADPEAGETRYGYIDRSEEHTSELQSPCNLVC